MTLGIAWVGTRSDGRRHLYLASDSRTRGSMIIDVCPKIIPLARGDCAICFAGDTAATYPLMLQLQNAVNAHQPALDRTLDIGTLKTHLLRVFTDMVNGITDAAMPIKPSDVRFIFAGYSWMSKDFKIWTITYSNEQRVFHARDSVSFNPALSKVAFIGDWAKQARTALHRHLTGRTSRENKPVEYEPFEVLRDLLRVAAANKAATIGGAPQLVRIGEHMNTRVLAIRWPNSSGKPNLMGRELYDYENTDNWILDPDTLKIYTPRSFGNRSETPLESAGNFVIE
jgi:hypothetical protein